MKKLIRFLLWFVAALVVLGIILGIALQVLIDPNDYREDIAAAVTDATGRELIIEGDLSLKTFPCCGVRLGPLELSNPPGFPDEHFARVENAAVSVRLLPLILSQELAVGEVVLDGLDLILISRADGSANWEFGETVDEEQPVEAEATDSAAAIGGVAVAGVAVTGGRILYIDEALGEEIEVGNINLSTSEIDGDSPFELEASLDVSGLAPDTAIALDLKTGAVLDIEASTVDLAGLAMSIDASGGDLPGGAARLDVQVAEATGLGADEFSLAGIDVTVRAAGLDIALRGAGKVVGETPVLAGDFSIAEFSPRELLQELGEPPMNTADPAVLAKAGLQSDWKLDGDVAQLSNFSFTLDDSTATGWLNVASIENERIEFDLQFDAIDVDRYSEPVIEGEDKGSGGETEESSDALDLPVEDMRALNLDGRLGFGSLRVSEALLTNVNINVSAKDGLIRLNPLTADIYGGQYSGDIGVDVRGDTPKMSVNENLSGFRLGDFLKDTQGDANVSGVANMRVTATSSGDTISALKKVLNGDASVDLQEGKYLGVDLWHEIRAARAKIRQEEAPPDPADPYTDISQFSATAQFADGIVQNRDLVAKAPLMSLTGSGDINLVESIMDYRLEAKVTGEKEFEDGYTIDDFEGIRIPVKLKGPLDDPGVTVELGKVLGDLAKRKAQDRLLKKLGIDEDEDDKDKDNGDEESSDPKEKLKKGLRGLFDR